MTDAEKLAKILAAFQNLVTLREHLRASGQIDQLPAASTHTLTKIAEIIGFPGIFSA